MALLWHRCGTGVALVWHRCGNGVALVWHWCGTGVALVWHRCDVSFTFFKSPLLKNKLMFLLGDTFQPCLIFVGKAGENGGKSVWDLKLFSPMQKTLA